MDLDGAPQPTSEAEVDRTEGGGQRCRAAAGNGGDLRRKKSAMRQLRGRVHEQHVDSGCTGPTKGGP